MHWRRLNARAIFSVHGLDGIAFLHRRGSRGFLGLGLCGWGTVTAGPGASVEADSTDGALPAPGGAWMAAALSALLWLMNIAVISIGSR